jgi:hypothetical protein
VDYPCLPWLQGVPGLQERLRINMLFRFFRETLAGTVKPGTGTTAMQDFRE